MVLLLIGPLHLLPISDILNQISQVRSVPDRKQNRVQLFDLLRVQNAIHLLSVIDVLPVEIGSIVHQE